MTVVWSLIAGGLLGTMVLTTLVRCGSELGYTRMDLAFLLGTMVTSNRVKAKALGYVLHFALGFAFALAYGLLFVILGRSSWQLGAAIGIVHSLFVSAVLINVLLPLVHPRMGTPDTAAHGIALIEPPGFLMRNYGRNTFLLS